MPEMTPGQEVVADLLRRFPDHGSKTIARIAYKEHPECFANLEAARQTTQRSRGRRGSSAIAGLGENPRGPGDPFDFAKVPNGLKHYEDWRAVQFAGPMRVLVLPDLHIPYHDKESTLAAMRCGKDFGCDTVVLNGDLADFFSISFWEQDPRKRGLKKEIKLVRQFLGALRAAFKDARIIYKAGNHEERWERYLTVKAPELLGVPEFDLSRVYELDYWDEDEDGRKVLKKGPLGIEPMIGEKRPVRLGSLNLLHGHEYGNAVTNPVNPARGLFLRSKAFAMCSHYHQSSYHSESTVEGKNIACWSTGCLCDMHPEFQPLNKWNLGFALVEVAESGKFDVHNKFVGVGGKVYGS
jgi:hypothetical protein